METVKGLKKSCETCLYMATHEKCDNCLHSKEDWSKYHSEGRLEMPPFRYLHCQEGNWFKRAYQFEIDGKRNIVIGGQGEAEVNTKNTPEHTAKHLHYVAEQCGYMVGTLTKKNGTATLKVNTSEGHFRLVWENNLLQRIERWNYDYDWDANKDNSRHISNFWDRQEIENLVFKMQD